MLAGTACSGDAQEVAEDRLCSIDSGSAEDKLLRQVIRADSYRTQVDHTDSGFVERMQEELRTYPGAEATNPVRQCGYVPKGAVEGQASVQFDWAPAADAKKGAGVIEGTRTYDLNGATGRSHDVSTDLYVQCDMPDELSGASKKALLHANASFTVNLGNVKDHGTQDQQMSFVYQMARRAAEVLGCTNNPLAKDPVVKPLTESTP
ncbi:hypothetical protein ABZ135_28615 [Streptomyces sp. NPDC006339]|uniref:hypothetical protein n=1 Tax=Streptomyces sp. NPDC006339 TaxID=3156755 RepID=UPI0033A9BAF4